MSSTLLPFLYQTRTLRRPFGLQFAASSFARFGHSSRRPKLSKRDNAIPFEWESDELRDEMKNGPSTITPSEAQVFKKIFDEISQGRMTPARKRPSATLANSSNYGSETGGSRSSGQQNSMARSIVEQARVTEFRDKFLSRYPRSLRNAARMALGLFELEPESSDSDTSRMTELDEADKAKCAEYDRARAEELVRVESLMRSCETDEALWRVMQQEVFSLPAELGIFQRQRKHPLPHQQPSKPQPKSAVSKKKQPSTAQPKPAAPKDEKPTALKEDKLDASNLVDPEGEGVEGEKRIMDVHGPLYSQFISIALGLFDTAFAHPSPYAFQILPRIKELGLPSYVLGVSTPFYSRLARIYWDRFGDANSALDMLQEMNSVGLYADEEVQGLLAKMRDDLHGCTWGAQGPFVMAMMESPPDSNTLVQRLESIEKVVEESLSERYQDSTGYAS